MQPNVRFVTMVGILLLGVAFLPAAAAADADAAADAEQVNCGTGYVGQVCTAAVGLVCAPIDFLFGAGTCSRLIQ